MQGEERLGKSDPVQAILWDEKLCEKYKNGTSVVELATEYSLSEKSIQRIIRTTVKAQ